MPALAQDEAARTPISFPKGSVFGEELSRALELKGVGWSRRSVVPKDSWVFLRWGRIAVGSREIQGVRIGAIPQLEVQDMSWTVHGDPWDLAWCRDVKGLFDKERHLRDARIEGFELVFESGGKPSLSADRVRFDDRGLVLSGARLVDGDRERSFPEAVLSLDMETLGQLNIQGLSGDAFRAPLPSDSHQNSNVITQP